MHNILLQAAPAQQIVGQSLGALFVFIIAGFILNAISKKKTSNYDIIVYIRNICPYLGNCNGDKGCN